MNSSPMAERWRSFGTSVFAEMTQLATAHHAINLAQGFPDFEGPGEIVAAAADALRAGHNQYARSMGMPDLVHAISAHQQNCYGLAYDPMREIMVTCGATEAIAASLCGLLNPSDEVILFEPFYDSYPAMSVLAGATPRYLTLRFPDFALEPTRLAALIGPKTRGIVLNNPHNPSGKVFSKEELLTIAKLAIEHDLWVISDEVYEHLTYDGESHIPIASLPGMRERTLTLSSTGKTYSFTGWKVGWACGPEPLVQAAQAAHQFMTFSGAAPLQVAMAHALTHFQTPFFGALRTEYTARRDVLVRALREAGFEVAEPKGTYFILAGFADIFDGDDRELARRLVTEAGVAAIPPSAFYTAEPQEGARLLRFAFCKKLETLERAAERLLTWRKPAF